MEEEKVQRDKERLAAKLDGSKTSSSATITKPSTELVQCIDIPFYYPSTTPQLIDSVN